MIKKLLTLTVLLSIFAASQVRSQCTPNTSIVIPGVYPDSATGLQPGYVGTPYSEVIQVRIPVDTVFQGNIVPIIDFEIDSINGLPPAFSYASNPGTGVFPGGTNGCILISGMPAATGTYNLDVYGVAHGLLFGSPAQLPFVIDYYKIVIHPASGAGVPQNASYSFTVSQNEPNPFSSYSDIHFTSPSGGKADLKVYNMIGKEIYSGSYRVITGKNTIRIDARDFESGVYMYTLNMGQNTVTKRMIISKK